MCNLYYCNNGYYNLPDETVSLNVKVLIEGSEITSKTSYLLSESVDALYQTYNYVLNKHHK